MPNEQSKAAKRRFNDGAFHSRYFVGHGIDVGGAPDPLGQYIGVFSRMESVKTWDLADGDAQLLSDISDNQYDFLHSSHCLEHMRDVEESLKNWVRVVKPGGYLILTVPDEDLYELGFWPSRFNSDHKWSFTINKSKSWSPRSINVLNLLDKLSPIISIEKIELQKDFFREALSEKNIDQTRCPPTECAIEIILQKRDLAQNTNELTKQSETYLQGQNIENHQYYKPLFSPWLGYGDFSSEFNAIKGLTIVSADRAYVIWTLLKQSIHLKGQVWECGTYKGGTALLMSNVIDEHVPESEIELHLFDTFEGIPSVDGDKDLHQAGDFNDVDIEAVKKRFSDHNFVNFHIGKIPGTFQGMEPAQIAFAHIDVDVYQSVLDCCSFIFPKLKPGGVMVFDDYGFPSCPGARKAVDEYFSEKIEKPLVLPTGQAIVFKISDEK